MTGLLNPKPSEILSIVLRGSRFQYLSHGIFSSGINSRFYFLSMSVFGRGLNAFTAGNLLRGGTNLLEVSVGRGFGGSKGVKLPVD